MRVRWTACAIGVAAAWAAAAEAAPSEPVSIPASERTPVDRRLTNLLDRLPLAFETNRGQAPESWDFLVRCRGYHAFVASTGVVFSFDGAGLAMSLDGASRCEPSTTGAELPGRVNYFLGNDPMSWITEIPLSRGAEYRDAAPGTTWRFGGRGRSLEFTFDLAPGVDGPRLRLDGAGSVRVADDGSLRVAMPHGEATIGAPVAWQDVPGKRLDAKARWTVEKGGVVRIDVSPGDPGRMVHVDPTVTYASYLGASGADVAGGAAMDGSGAAYIAGSTHSPNFPTTTGAFSTTKQNDASMSVRADGFVTKVNSTGSALVYSTYIGGSTDEVFTAVVVDAFGSACVGGHSYSSNYPTTSAYRTSAPGGAGVLTKFSSSGSSLVFSTYTAMNSIRDLAVGAGGSFYVIEGGQGISCYSAFGSSQIFYTRLEPGFSSMGQSMTIDAVGSDPNGDAYVVGTTDMTNYNATTGAYQTTLAGRRDAFVTKVTSTGSIAYTTFVGGSQDEYSRSVGVNAGGQAYVVGKTYSSNFPVLANAYRASITGTEDSFVSRVSASGNTLRYSSYLGGGDPLAIQVHPCSSFVIAGYIGSSGFPTVSPFQAAYAGGVDGIALKFNRDNTIAWASCFGGSSDDYLNQIGMAPDGTVVLAGETVSTDLPTVSPFQSSKSAATEVCFLKVPDSLPTSVAPLDVVTSSLPTWTVGYAYTPLPLEASGGIAPYLWSIASGALPTGASMTAFGVLSGTLTQTGTYTFKVHVEDACEFPAERQLTLRVNPPPSITSATMPGATIGTPYDRLVPSVDGSGTMTFSVTAGSTPPGTTLGSDGHLAGTPTQLGDFLFTVRVVDGLGASGSRQVSVHVSDRPVLTAATMPQWTETRLYTYQFQAARGTAPLLWSVVGGAVPTVTALDPVTGGISGAAKAAGIHVFTLRVTDGAGASADQQFTTTINALPVITSAALSMGAIGRPYASLLLHTGGTAPFSWRIEGGTLPPGLALDAATGLVHGDLTGPPSGFVTFVCNDMTGASSTRALAIPSAAALNLAKKKSSEKVALGSGDTAPPTIRRYLEVTAGTFLGIVVTGGGGAGAGPALHLFDGAANEIDLAPFTRETAKSLQVKGAVLGATGRYFLTVKPPADAKGSLKLTVTIAPPTSWKSEVTLGGGGSTEIAFSAAPGARLSIAMKAPKASALLPTIVAILAPDGTDLLPGGTVKERGGAATFTSKVALAGGDYRVTFGGRDGSAGAVAWSIALKAPKTYSFALTDVTAGD